MNKQLDFTEAEIETMLANLDLFSPEEVAEIDRMVDELNKRSNTKRAYDDLIEFCKYMQPDYIVGKHHRILADMLMAIERGDKDRICVNIPPRHGKSQLVSIMFPAWFLGRNPTKKVMMVSHTTDLAVDFGRKVRNPHRTDGAVSDHQHRHAGYRHRKGIRIVHAVARTVVARLSVLA